MNEIFNFKRFGTYFLYDLRQMWQRHSRPAIFIGCSVVILYVVWIIFGLLFTQRWSAPPVEARFVLWVIAFTILEFYQARTYGYLTDPREGADWLMVPASRTEKFISMLLITLVVIPVLFIVVFFALDGFLSLVDPTFGKPLVTGFWSTYRKILEMSTVVGNESPIVYSTGTWAFMSIVSFFANYLYFLLCGICFKRNKVVWALAIIFAFSTLISILTGVLVPLIFLHHPTMDLDPMQAARVIAGIMNGAVAVSCIAMLGFGWGVWRRIKTLQH